MAVPVEELHNLLNYVQQKSLDLTKEQIGHMIKIAAENIVSV